MTTLEINMTTNQNSSGVTFCCNEMGIPSVKLNNINLDNNFDEDDPDTVILIRLCILNSKNAIHLKNKWRINAKSVES